LVFYNYGTFADDWQKMLEEPKFSDVVFLLEDGQEKLEAHKLVLCSASNFFRQILGLPNTTKVKILVHVYSFLNKAYCIVWYKRVEIFCIL
jgi:hypothetical protein